MLLTTYFVGWIKPKVELYLQTYWNLREALKAAQSVIGMRMAM